MTTFLYKHAAVVFVVYDITDKNSFINTKKYFNAIEEFCDFKPVVILIGNKTDLDINNNRKVSFEEGDRLAKDKGFTFFETSAKKNINVKNV
jgi:GTPase SAR1 family protein